MIDIYSPRAIMAAIDEMPKEWRALVYEYGFQIVGALINEGCSLADAKATLPGWRKRKQEELLNERFERVIRTRPAASVRGGPRRDRPADAGVTSPARTRRKGTRRAKGKGKVK